MRAMTVDARPKARTVGCLLALLAVIAGGGSPGVGRASSGDQLWAASYPGSGAGEDTATTVVPSPDGTRIFVTGYSYGSGTSLDYVTVAYDSATGSQLWAANYDGPGHLFDYAYAIAVSPDGTRVFVTGGSYASWTGERADYATIAYDAANGATLWTARYNGPGNSDDVASAIALSPDGTRVFVTGRSEGAGTHYDYATLAYDAASGATLWAARYGTPGGYDQATALGVGPGGSRVFVTGLVGSSDNDYATLAYDAVSGATLWVSRYNSPGNGFDGARALVVDPDGTRVFVTGGSHDDYATIAYDTSSGGKLWEARTSGPGGGRSATPNAIAVSPDGGRVFVTGWSAYDYVTVAYDTSNGASLWESRYGSAASADQPTAVAVSPDGAWVFVAGGSDSDHATVSYDASTGAQNWEARYTDPTNRRSQWAAPHGLAVSPDGDRVFVTGTSAYDYVTIAYDAQACTPGSSAHEDGVLSDRVHSTVEPGSGALRPTVHQVNCDVVAAHGL